MKTRWHLTLVWLAIGLAALASVSRADDRKIPLDPDEGGRSIDGRALRPGDVILSTTSSSISEKIRASDGSPVSHTILYVGKVAGEHMVIESTWTGGMAAPKVVKKVVAKKAEGVVASLAMPTNRLESSF